MDVCTVSVQYMRWPSETITRKREGGEQHVHARLLQRAYFRLTFSIKISHRYTGTGDGRSGCAVLRYGRQVKRECVVFMKKEKYNSNCLLICLAAPRRRYKDTREGGWPYPLREDKQGFYREETAMGKVKADWL